MTAPLRPDPLLSAAVAWNYLASGVGLPPAHLAQQYPFKGASGWQGVDPTPGQVKACCGVSTQPRASVALRLVAGAICTPIAATGETLRQDGKHAIRQSSRPACCGEGRTRRHA